MRSGQKKMRCSSNMKPRFRAEWVVVSEELLTVGASRSYNNQPIDWYRHHAMNEYTVAYLGFSAPGGKKQWSVPLARIVLRDRTWNWNATQWNNYCLNKLATTIAKVYWVSLFRLTWQHNKTYSMTISTQKHETHKTCTPRKLKSY